MIPKTLHYCWFGRGPKPARVLSCLESWRKYLPDYTFVEWNEDNFEIDRWPYAREAYDNKKYAFVSDVARLYALYTQGGVYLDTDVELLGSLDPFLQHEAFTGYERGVDITSGVMGAKKGSPWIKENLDWYEGKHFQAEDGTLDLTINVRRITDFLVARGFRRDNTYQEIEGFVTVYPGDYFSPLDPLTRKIRKTENTVAIHHYLASWEPVTPVLLFRKLVMRTLGVEAYNCIRAVKLKLFPKAWK